MEIIQCLDGGDRVEQGQGNATLLHLLDVSMFYFRSHRSGSKQRHSHWRQRKNSDQSPMQGICELGDVFEHCSAGPRDLVVGTSRTPWKALTKEDLGVRHCCGCTV